MVMLGTVEKVALVVMVTVGVGELMRPEEALEGMGLMEYIAV